MKLNTTLDDENSRRFQAIKEHMGVKRNCSVLQWLIGKEYGRIQRSKLTRVFLPKEVYVKVEKAANARDQTIYEYVEEITDNLLREHKEKTEGSKHEN